MLHTQLFHFHCYQIFCCNEAWAKCHQIWMEIRLTLGQRSGSATAACKGGSRWKCKCQPSSSLWATLKHHTKVTSHFQTCRTCRAPRSAHMQVAVAGVTHAALHRILLVTSVEPEEWGAGWQVRGRAHESWVNELRPLWRRPQTSKGNVQSWNTLLESRNLRQVI